MMIGQAADLQAIFEAKYNRRGREVLFMTFLSSSKDFIRELVMKLSPYFAEIKTGENETRAYFKLPMIRSGFDLISGKGKVPTVLIPVEVLRADAALDSFFEITRQGLSMSISSRGVSRNYYHWATRDGSSRQFILRKVAGVDAEEMPSVPVGAGAAVATVFRAPVLPTSVRIGSDSSATSADGVRCLGTELATLVGSR